MAVAVAIVACCHGSVGGQSRLFSLDARRRFTICKSVKMTYGRICAESEVPDSSKIVGGVSTDDHGKVHEFPLKDTIGFFHCAVGAS